MMQLILQSSLLIFSIIFIQMNHPLAMGLMLLVQTTLICLSISMMMKTSWYAYILFLVFMGGMLVLFIYTTSLASNEMFTFSTKMMILSMSLLLFTAILSIMNKNFLMNLINNEDMKSTCDQLNMIKENTLMLNKLYNYPTNMTSILLMIYLLITLIAVVKITKMFYGPLRLMH